MTNRRRIILPAAIALLPAWLAAQQPAWIANPGSDPIAMRMNRPAGQKGPVTGKPFSGTEVRHSVQTFADGSHADQSETSIFARDEFGRMRTANDKNVVIFDPVAGFTYTLDVPSKTYSRRPLSGYETEYTVAVAGSRVSTTSVSQSGDVSAPRARPANSAPQTVEELPAQSIDGLLAKGSRVTVTIPAGTIGNNKDLKVVNERWYSPDMQILLKSSNTDPRFGTTTYELTDLAQAPPNPSLFQVPSDYRLREDHFQH